MFWFNNKKNNIKIGNEKNINEENINDIINKFSTLIDATSKNITILFTNLSNDFENSYQHEILEDLNIVKELKSKIINVYNKYILKNSNSLERHRLKVYIDFLNVAEYSLTKILNLRITTKNEKIIREKQNLLFNKIEKSYKNIKSN